MNSLNKAQVIGNLTRDPELKQTANGQSVCTLGLATNRYWSDSSGQKKEDVEFHNIVCWGKLAEICAEYLKKGAKVFFEGRLQTRNWEDDAGIKHYRTEIVANDMIMLSPKGSASSDGGNNYEKPADKVNPTESGREDALGQKPKKEDVVDIDTEDLPF